MSKSSNAQVLSISKSSEKRVEAPVDRGKLLTAAQVASELFNGTVSAAWVRRNVPQKVVLGHSTIRWYVADVQVWISTKRSPCGLPPAATDC